MEVYISGKIGEEVISDATREKFERKKKYLRKKGFDVFNPCNEAWQRALVRGYRTDRFDVGGLPANTIPFYDYVLLMDLMALSIKDAIFCYRTGKIRLVRKTNLHLRKPLRKEYSSKTGCMPFNFWKINGKSPIKLSR